MKEKKRGLFNFDNYVVFHGDFRKPLSVGVWVRSDDAECSI